MSEYIDRKDWEYEVANGDTVLGFDEWTEHRAEVEEHPICPACGSVIDYCQGHGTLGDPEGARILEAHDDDEHDECHENADCYEEPEYVETLSRDQMWDSLIVQGVTDQTLQIVVAINGYSTETMLDVLYAATGYRSFDQLED